MRLLVSHGVFGNCDAGSIPVRASIHKDTLLNNEIAIHQPFALTMSTTESLLQSAEDAQAFIIENENVSWQIKNTTRSTITSCLGLLERIDGLTEQQQARAWRIKSWITLTY